MADGNPLTWGNVSSADRAPLHTWCSEHVNDLQWAGCRREPSGPGHVGVYLILAPGAAGHVRARLEGSWHSRRVEHPEGRRTFAHLVSSEGELLAQYRLRKADLIEVWPRAPAGGLDRS
jgi:hypothetical protein